MCAIDTTVMDPLRGIAEFPHSFKECHTDVRTGPSEILDNVLLLFVIQRQWLLLCLNVRGSLGPHCRSITDTVVLKGSPNAQMGGNFNQFGP